MTVWAGAGVVGGAESSNYTRAGEGACMGRLKTREGLLARHPTDTGLWLRCPRRPVSGSGLVRRRDGRHDWGRLWGTRRFGPRGALTHWRYRFPIKAAAPPLRVHGAHRVPSDGGLKRAD